MPIEMPPEDLETQAAESILGDTSVRDELTDDEAQPLINWGLAQIKAVLGRQQEAAPAEEALDDLRKLLKRINRFTGKRMMDAPEDLRRDLERMAKYSRSVHGEDFPAPDEAQLDAFMQEHEALTNGEVVQKLMQLFAPRPPAEASPGVVLENEMRDDEPGFAEE